jgi:hypothetical protein
MPRKRITKTHLSKTLLELVALGFTPTDIAKAAEKISRPPRKAGRPEETSEEKKGVLSTIGQPWKSDAMADRAGSGRRLNS